ncbi:MAG TPA: RtcB family protein [Candidatus Nanoarchaeia archaeon]|nr:RtcB family protein [Candidatus Nanoarchaeia archaeon]
MEIPTKRPPLKKISDVVWEISQDYKKDKPAMQVPARIYGTKKLIDSMDLMVYEQISNVACLPGIQKAAMCMPDGHWGYGFPIGGVAAFDLEKGIISPGGIGYDINCIHPDTKISTKYGYFKKVKDFSGDFSNERISFIDLQDKQKKDSNAILFLRKEVNKILKIKTKCGEEILLTEDHPVYTGKDMVEAGSVKIDDTIVTHPFTGVEYEEPEEKIILDEGDIIRLIGNRWKLIKELKDKELLPLKTTSKKLPTLAKLLGFLTGDGWLGHYYSEKRKMNIWSMRAIGKPEDLEEVRKDISELGYETNFLSTKSYSSEVKEIDGGSRKIDGKSTQLYINSQSLSVLLCALGLPKGNKSRTKVSVPNWIKESPLWIKRLYLAGLFGAELTKPAQRKGEFTSFIEPSFSQNKINSLDIDNMNFILDVINLLSEFGVNTNKIYRQKGVKNSYDEETHKLSLRISTKPENLLNLWGKIGYEYCKERKELSMLAIAYLKYKLRFLEKLRKFIIRAKGLKEKGVPISEILTEAENFSISKSFVEGQLYQRRLSLGLRITQDFPIFEEFKKLHQMTSSEFVLDEIDEIVELPYGGFVYDFTMNDSNHNFVANSIVSHNCGMRLIKTNFTIKDVQPKIKELVNTLYKRVPAGVGATAFAEKEGILKLTKQQFKEVVEQGADWVVKQGYGWKEDLPHIESHGHMDGADSSKISDKALSRGIHQVGTLGSGNHYLEIQHIKKENIFDEKIAKKFGLFEDQIVIMFHCGSRGFGHQIATDYISQFMSVMGPKYGIEVRDRELVCVPFQSKEGQDYFKAMQCAVNMAFANRQMILHEIRKSFENVFGMEAEKMGLDLIYDVAHNIAKVEEHLVDGKKKELVVHRKGATRCFGPERKELAPIFRETGQPVIVGGSMETGSYLCVGTEKAEETWGSTMHGSGRTMSRGAARRQIWGEKLQKDMEAKGIYVKSVSMSGLSEEAGFAYKDINEVVETMHQAGISKKVVHLLPIGNVKG